MYGLNNRAILIFIAADAGYVSGFASSRILQLEDLTLEYLQSNPRKVAALLRINSNSTSTVLNDNGRSSGTDIGGISASGERAECLSRWISKNQGLVAVETGLEVFNQRAKSRKCFIPQYLHKRS